MPRNDREAVKWFRLAAKQGNTAAQNKLAEMEAKHENVPIPVSPRRRQPNAEDDKEALKQFRLAAEKGHAEAQNRLGWMYENGRGVPQDYKEAIKWYRLAAKQGFANAQNKLAEIEAKQAGTRKNR